MTKEALHKIETFVKVALSEITDLRNQIDARNLKLAEVQKESRELGSALKKAAEAMYNADFINDEEEKSTFIKKSQEDPVYLAKVVERVCKASDVAYMGKVASVKSSTHSEDPVIRRAFGYSNSYSLLDDE